jgi:GST-like protein
MSYRLLSSPGTGSAIIEAMLALKSFPYTLEDFDYSRVLAGDPALMAKNPLSEIPVLVLPDGTVMTESLAILLVLDEVVRESTATSRDRLVPPAGTPERARVYRWAAFIVASIYPTFTYGDSPDRWIDGAANSEILEKRTDAYREELWRILEREAAVGPYFTGDQLTIVDLYIGVMHSWRPGRKWFAANTPKLERIAANVAKHPKLAAVWARNFRSES